MEQHRETIERLANDMANEGMHRQAQELLALLEVAPAPFSEQWKAAVSTVKAAEQSEPDPSYQQPALMQAYKIGIARGTLNGLTRSKIICSQQFSSDFATSQRRQGANACAHDIGGELLDARKSLRDIEIASGLREDDKEKQ